MGTTKHIRTLAKRYEEVREALGILRLAAQGEKDVRDGRWSTQDAVFRRLGRRLIRRR